MDSRILFDEADRPLVEQYTWVVRDNTWNLYANAWVDGRPMTMHRLLMSPPKGRAVDHINGNGLDNRRSNLRICTYSENAAHRTKLQKNNQSGVTGVHRHTDGRWRARIAFEGRDIHLGLFLTIEEATAARRAGEAKYHGQFSGV